MVLADCLSWFPSRKENMPIKLHKNTHILHNWQIKHRGSVEKEPIHSTIYRLTLNGWSERIQEVPSIPCHFWGTRDKLTIENGVLLKGDRVCICPGLYERMLSDLHNNHRGIEKMRHLSQTTIYWSRIDADIANYVNQWKICTQHIAKQAVHPMLLWDVPDSPWQDLAADFFTYNHKEYFLIEDTFSKCSFMYQTSSKSADSIIRKLHNLTSQYGPQTDSFQIMDLYFHQKPSKKF